MDETTFDLLDNAADILLEMGYTKEQAISKFREFADNWEFSDDD